MRYTVHYREPDPAPISTEYVVIWSRKGTTPAPCPVDVVIALSLPQPVRLSLILLYCGYTVRLSDCGAELIGLTLRELIKRPYP